MYLGHAHKTWTAEILNFKANKISALQGCIWAIQETRGRPKYGYLNPFRFNEIQKRLIWAVQKIKKIEARLERPTKHLLSLPTCERGSALLIS